MSTSNNGGPAFPAGSVRKSRPAHDAGGDWVETDRVQPLHQGLTIRDYFAAKAISTAVRRLERDWSRDMGKDEWDWLDEDYDYLAEEAYKIADAMLEARQL